MDFPHVLWGSVTKNIEYSTIPGLVLPGIFLNDALIAATGSLIFTMKFF
jgi:hypothetical protein